MIARQSRTSLHPLLAIAAGFAVVVSLGARPDRIRTAAPSRGAAAPGHAQTTGGITVTTATSVAGTSTATIDVPATVTNLPTGTEDGGATPGTTASATPRAVSTATLGATLAATQTTTSTATIASTATPGAATTVSATLAATATPLDAPTLPRSAETGRAFVPLVARDGSWWPPAPRSWGVQFPLDEEAISREEYAQGEFRRWRELGMQSVRTNVRWEAVERQNTTPDRYDWRELDERLGDYTAEGYDLVLTIVAYPRWATRYRCGYALLPGMEVEWREFVAEVARRYGGPPYRLAAIEIGNEPDGKSFITPDDFDRLPEWGQGEPTVPHGGCWSGRESGYVAFLAAAFQAVKAVDPAIPVALGGLAFVDLEPNFRLAFLDDLLAAGAGPYFDVLSYHWFPDVSGQVFSGPEKLDLILSTLARYGLAKRLWLTETYKLVMVQAPEAGRRAQFAHLTRDLVTLLGRPELERVYWFGIIDYPPRHKWRADLADRGLVTHDHDLRPAAGVVPYVTAFTNGVPEDISTDRVVAWRFSWPGDAHDHVIAWPRFGSAAALRLPAADGDGAVVRGLSYEALRSGRGPEVSHVSAVGGTLAIEVGSESVFAEIPLR